MENTSSKWSAILGPLPNRLHYCIRIWAHHRILVHCWPYTTLCMVLYYYLLQIKHHIHQVYLMNKLALLLGKKRLHIVKHEVPTGLWYRIVGSWCANVQALWTPLCCVLEAMTKQFIEKYKRKHNGIQCVPSINYWYCKREIIATGSVLESIHIDVICLDYWNKMLN